MVIENAWVAVREPKSETCTLNENTPLVEGVPLMTPVDEFSARPVGRKPELGTIDQLYGGCPPPAVNVCEYTTPADPPGKEVVRIESGAATNKDIAWAKRVLVASLRTTTSENDPSAVGLPVRVPLESMLRPWLGPEKLHE